MTYKAKKFFKAAIKFLSCPAFHVMQIKVDTFTRKHIKLLCIDE